jgi:hypothetical protein
LLEDVVAVDQFFALSIATHNVRVAARIAKRLAFYGRSVLNVNASHTNFFLTGNDRNCGAWPRNQCALANADAASAI